jgi:Flp pilus assembly protein TadD
MVEATLEILRPTSSEALTPQIIPESAAPKSDVKLDLEDLFCILQITPNDSLIALELARRLSASGRFDESVRVLRSVIRIDYRFETLNDLGQAEYHAEEFDRAFEHLHQAILVAPENSPLLFDVFKTLGNIFVRRGDFDSAEDNYNKAHRLNAESDVLYVNLGTLAVQKQDWDTAVEKFRQALNLNRSNDKAWVGLAIGHRMKGDGELAWGNIEAAIEYNPLNEVALTLALDWAIQEGREFRVLELIRNFLVEGGWNERFSMAFSWLSFRRGDRFVAGLELERLLAVNPGHVHGLQLAQEMRTHA